MLKSSGEHLSALAARTSWQCGRAVRYHPHCHGPCSSPTNTYIDALADILYTVLDDDITASESAQETKLAPPAISWIAA